MPNLEQYLVLIENAEREWSKPEILGRLDAIVTARLFEGGSRSWLANHEAASSLRKTLQEMKLEELVPGTDNTWRCTTLGSELNIDLVNLRQEPQ
jgi:hypothetical protein